MVKLFLLFLIFAQITFSQGLSKKCFDELLAIPEKNQNFYLQGFLTKDLPAEIVKVKAQLKLPFGKPADSKVTDIGVTVGCLKGFPENSAQIQAMLKDVSLEMAKLGVNKLGANVLAGGGVQGVAAIGTGIIAKKVSAEPVLKECDAVFNTDKKFCHDGEVYDKCDGVVYNPSTHICNGDVAYRAVCNGVQYNPLTQKCEGDAVSATCGEAEYNPTTHNCKDSALFLFPKCGETAYNPETHGCGQNNVLLTKCGTLYYDPAKQQGCGEDNRIYPKCGTNLYNHETHICENNAVVAKQAKIEEVRAESVVTMQEEKLEEPKKSKRRVFSLGFRTGLNFSHVYESYRGNSGSSDSKAGLHAGLVFDIAASIWFHIQPGIMYIQKGAEYKGYNEVWHYIELFPTSISLKFSALRLNFEPYISNIILTYAPDFGFNYGFGFDVGNFYLGMFYEYGLINMERLSTDRGGYDTYNRTLGFTLGYNL